MLSPNQIASEKIQQARQDAAATLDLSGLKLLSLPKEIGQLRQLKKLYLNDNQLNTMTSEIGRLTQLQEIYLNNNKLATLPKNFVNLKQLRRLEINNNILTNFPKCIRYLNHLQELHLSKNKINGLPNYIIQLTQLEKLSLAYNNIRKLPSNIGELKLLQELDVSYNQINNIPVGVGALDRLRKLYLSNNEIHHLPAEIGQLMLLKILDVHNNYLSFLPEEIANLRNLNSNQTENFEELGLNIGGNRFGVPEEILGRDPKGIMQYIFDLQASKKNKPLHEAKLIFIGSGYVGKTSLINMLLTGSYNIMEDKTDGIEIREWTIRRGKDEINLNIWDFGGQEIMHATHRFFMTSRSAYVLVINPRAEDKYGDSELEYWLKLIRSYAGDSVPIVVTVNKCETHKADIPKGEIRDKYPNVIGFVETSCKEDIGLGNLRKTIRRAINHLAHIDDLLPQSYFEIKDLLKKRNDDYIQYNDYEQICQEIDPFFKKQSMKTLMGLLHDLGVMLNFGSNDRRLIGTQVLNPEWVTKGVYQIVTSARLIKNKGILRVRDIAKILNPERYPSERERFYIMDMMDRFELCYQMPDDRDTYFVPGAFPKDRPNIHWEHKTSEMLRFQYHYDVMPSSIMSRFIVKVHPFIRNRDYWRNGVVIKREGCYAFIKADPEETKIFIEITGRGSKRELLAFVRAQFDVIHARLPKINVECKIPVEASGKFVLDYQDLLFYEEMGESTILVRALRKRLNIKELLNGIETEDERNISRAKAKATENVNAPPSLEHTLGPISPRPILPIPEGKGVRPQWQYWGIAVGILAALAEFTGFNLKWIWETFFK